MRSSLPFNRCPASLVPLILDILSATSRQRSSTGAELPREKEPPVADGYHEKTVDLSGSTYDEMTVLYYNTFGSPFSCHQPQDGTEYNVAFVEKPIVMSHTSTDEARHYTVCIKLMKLPAVTAAPE